MILPLCLVLTLSWTLLTMHKTHYWKNNVVFWELMAARDRTGYAYLQLGYAYYSAGQYEKAVEAMNKVEPAPLDQRYYTTLSNSCSEIGDYECVRSLKKASTASGDRRAYEQFDHFNQ